MNFPSPADAPARIANGILETESWAREKLAPFAGRVFTLAVGPAATRFRIADDGKLETAEPSMPSDLDLVLSPLSVPAFLANPARWNEFVREEGDAALGGALKELARTLPWFVEAALRQGAGPAARPARRRRGTQAARVPRIRRTTVHGRRGELCARRSGSPGPECIQCGN